MSGVLIATDDRIADARRRRLAAVRAALVVGEAVAERYGDVLAVARSQRRGAKATDLLIIAAAAAERELYTLDAAQSHLSLAAGVPTTLLAA